MSGRTVPFTRGGAFQITASVSVPVTEAALREANQVVREFIAHGPTTAELDTAVERLLRLDVIRFQAPVELVAQLVTESESGLPVDWFNEQRRLLAALTDVDLSGVLTENRLITVVVGDLDTIGADLTSLTADGR